MPELTPVKPFRYTPPTIENTPCFIINLDSDKEKLAATKAVVNSIGFTAERFPAVLGRSLDLSAVKEVTSYARKFLEPATIGIFMSHKSVWKQVIKKQLPHAFVAEDDLFLDLPANYVRKYITNALKELPTDWDILYLGYAGLTNAPDEISTFLSTIIYLNPALKKGKYRKISERLFTPSFPLASPAYLISQKGAKKLLKSLRNIDSHVDLSIAQKISEGGWSVYALQRRMIHQTSSHTTGSTSKGAGGVFFTKIATKMVLGDPLPYEQNMPTSLGLSACTIFGWKALSLLTGIIAVTAVLVGAVTVRIDYALVGCFFLLLNSLDFIEGFSLSTTTIVLANTTVCIVCGFIGRIIFKKVIHL